MVQLVEVLCYKPEGRRFDFRSCHNKFSFPNALRPWGRLKPLKIRVPGTFPGRRGKGLTALPSSCLEIWELQHPGTILEHSRLVQAFTETALPSLLYPQYCYKQLLYDVNIRYCKNHISQYFFVGVREQVY